MCWKLRPKLETDSFKAGWEIWLSDALDVPQSTAFFGEMALSFGLGLGWSLRVCSGRAYFSGMECPPSPKTPDPKTQKPQNIKHTKTKPENPKILKERFDKAATFPSGAGRLWGWSSALPGRGLRKKGPHFEFRFKVWFRVLRLHEKDLAWFPIVVFASGTLKQCGGSPSSARGMSVAQGGMKL